MSDWKFSSKVRKIVLSIAVGGLGVYLLTFYCIPCRIVAVVLAGRSEQCTLQESLASYRYEQSRFLLNPQKPQLVQEEADGCQLWDMGQRRVWAPRAGSQWVGTVRSTRYRTLDLTGEVLTRPGDVVLDCGAYTGGSAWEALADGASQVISIEPSPRNLACLRRNLQPHIKDGRVMIVEKGVWDREDYLTIVEHPTNAAADHVFDVSDAHPEAQSQRVPLTTIDKLVEELQLERVDLIKMDIEGAEQHAIVGSKGTLVKHKPRLVIAAYHVPTDSEMIPILVKGFQPEYQMERGRCLLEGWRIWPHLLYFH